MGIFDMFRTPDINAEVERFRAEPGAALLDVRESDEYAEGHIPGSVNIPLSDIARVEARPVLERLPMDPQLAALCDEGRIELFEGDYFEGIEEVLEKLPKRK